MAFPNLTEWARKNLKKSEILEMIEELQTLVKTPNAGGAKDDEASTEARNRDYLSALGEDSRRGPARPSADAVKSFNERYPDANRIKQAL